ncbi:MAG: DUF2339 domain-containing protein [Candidatus Caenarcaniphilales bacterium]|nr:DUF2339 domain-containing protein [Candidatus Caenarcaniphilales bacterium]
MNEESNFRKDLAELKSSINQLNHKILDLEKRYEESSFPEKFGTEETEKNKSSKTENLFEKLENGSASIPNIIQNLKNKDLQKTDSTKIGKSGKPFSKLKVPKISFINLFGAITVVIAIVIFFKLAIDKGWLVATARVAIGYIFGLASLALGEYCQKKNYNSASIGFLGLGQMVLFLTTWFSERYFNLITWPVAFACYLAITALVAAQSLRYNSQAVATFGLLGGFLVPFLVTFGSQSSRGNLVFVAAYYLVLAAGVLFIAYKKSWNVLKWLSFLVNFLFLFVWAFSVAFSQEADKLTNIDLQLNYYLPFLFAFFVLYLAIACYRSLSLKTPLDSFDLGLVICVGAFSVIDALIALEGKHQVYVGLACILVSFVYAFICGEQLKRGIKSKKDFNTFLTVAVFFITIAIRLIVPIKLVSIAWALQAMALAYLSSKKDLEFLKTNYLLILLIIVFRLLLVDELFSSAIVINTAGTIKKYTPFTLPTISGLLSVVSFFYCLGQYEKSLQESTSELEKSKPKNHSLIAFLLWAGVLFGSLFCFSREFNGLANYFFSSSAAQGFNQFLIIIFVTGIIWTFCTTQLQTYNRSKTWLINIFCGVVVLESLNTFYNLGTYNHSEILISQISSLGLLLLLISIFILAKYLPESSSRENLKTFMFALGILLLMLFIRREAYLATYFIKNKDIYQIILSISYSLLALAVYVWGLLKQQKSKIWISYILFLFVGFKVYFNDLADLEQIYRGLSLLGFGSILLLCSFLEQKINQQRDALLEAQSQRDSQEDN